MWHILYKYIEKAMSEAVYEKIDDEYVGKIPCCWGIIAFASTLEKCKDELLSVLEDWILVGIRLGHPLPVVGGIDPNKDGMSLLDNEIELAKSRDTREDRNKAIDKIHDEYMVFWRKT